MHPIAKLTRFVLQWRWLVSAALLGSLVLAGVGIAQLQVDFALADLYGGNRKAVAALDAHVARWGDDAGNVVVVAEADEGIVLTPDRLAALHDISQHLAELPGVVEVESIVSVKRIVRPAPGVAVPAPLWKTRPSNPDRAAQWTAGLLRDPALVPMLVSADGRLALLSVRLSDDVAPIDRLRPVTTAIEELLAEHDGTAGLSLGAGGMAMVRANILDMVVTEQLFNVPASVTVILMFVIVMFRRVHGLVVPLVAVAVPTVWVLGIMGAVGEPIGLINQVTLTLVPAIAVADAIHLVYRYHEELRARVGALALPSPAQRADAIVDAAERVGAACFATSVTTAVGFLSLIAARMPVLSGFGIFAAIGVMLAYVSFLVALPIGLYVTGGTAPEAATGRTWVDRLLDGAVWLATTQLRPVLVVTAVLTAGFWAASSLVDVEYRLSDLLRPDSPETRVNRLVDDDLAGVISMDVAIEGDAITSPATLQAMDRLTQQLRELDGVRVVLSPTSLVRAVSRQMGGNGELPDGEALGPMFQAARDRSSLRRVLTPDGTHARIVVRSHDGGLRAFRSLAPQVTELAHQALDEHGVEVELIGSSPMVYAGVDEVTDDLRRSLLLAFAVVTAVLLVVFRSLKVALWSLPPNIIPLVVGYGLMGVLGWALEPAPAMIFTMALGIAIDASIHLIARYREERAAGATWETAVQRAIHGSGRAIVITTVIVAFALGMNVTSAFHANRVMGAVGAIVLMTSLVTALTFLAATLRFLDPQPTSQD